MSSKDKRHSKGKIKVYLQTEKGEISDELDLHGYLVEEALAEIEHYLDKSYLYGLSRVRIVHGHGTGKLRKAIREYLPTHPHVKKFHSAEPHYGGDAITIVQLETLD